MITDSDNYIITHVQYYYNDTGGLTSIDVKWVEKQGDDIINETYDDVNDIAKINLILQGQVAQSII